jgi:hypothetical protein
MERCWHGKFSGGEQCPSEGRYGNPGFRGRRERPELEATVKFMRAARWCATHKHPGDRLLGPNEVGPAPARETRLADDGDAGR